METLSELAERLEAYQLAIRQALTMEGRERSAAIYEDAVYSALARLIEAAKIAGELRGRHPAVYRFWDTEDGRQSCYQCQFCQERFASLQHGENPANHPAECLWRRAVELERGQK